MAFSERVVRGCTREKYDRISPCEKDAQECGKKFTASRMQTGCAPTLLSMYVTWNQRHSLARSYGSEASFLHGPGAFGSMKHCSERPRSARSAPKPRSNATCESHLPPPTPSPAAAGDPKTWPALPLPTPTHAAVGDPKTWPALPPLTPSAAAARTPNPAAAAADPKPVGDSCCLLMQIWFVS
jgi:hypothetical protein